MAGRNPSRQPFVQRRLISVPPRKSLVAGTAHDLGGADRWSPFFLTNTGGDHLIDHGRSGDAACGQPTRCSAVGDAGLELSERRLAGDGSGFEQ